MYTVLTVFIALLVYSIFLGLAEETEGPEVMMQAMTFIAVISAIGIMVEAGMLYGMRHPLG